MYKSLYFRLIGLIVRPEAIWKELLADRDTEGDEFNRNYFHPAIGIIALFAFAGSFISSESFTHALKVVICEAVAYFGGLYAAAYGIRYVSSKFFATNLTQRVCEKFAGYSSAAVYIAAMAASLLTAIPVVRLFGFYSFLIAYLGVIHYLGINDDRKYKIMLGAGALILLAPALIRWLINTLII